MNGSIRRRLIAAAVAAALVGLAAAGIAYAAIPDGTGVIHGCYANKGGSLRVIDTGLGQSCDSKNETSLTWSQTGPSGARGPTGAKGTTGATGAKGPSGATGPSDAFTNYGTPTQISSLDTQTVTSVTLPAGNYTLSASIRAVNDDGDTNLLACDYVSAGTLHEQQAVVSLQGQGSDIDALTFPMIGDVTISTDGTAVFLRCEPAFTATFIANMIATKVGAITPTE